MPFEQDSPIYQRAQARQGRMLAAAEKHRLVKEGRMGDAAYEDEATLPDAEGRPLWWVRLAGRLSRRDD